MKDKTGIPTELIRIDKDTGEICIGDDCFAVKYEPKKNTVALEFNPNSSVCNPQTKKVIEDFMTRAVTKKAKVKFREKRSLEED